MRSPVLASSFLAFLLVPVVTGCSTRAHRDLYQQRLAGEVRILEDQLYEADYENRVLRDELNACKDRKTCVPDDVHISVPQPPSGDLYGGEIIDASNHPVIDSVGPYSSHSAVQDGAPIGGDFENGFDLGIENGQVVEPSDLPETISVPQPVPDKRSDDDDSNAKKEPFKFDPDAMASPLSDPDDDVSDPPADVKPMLPPAPTRPQPPGILDLLPEPIIEGDVTPPMRPGGAEELPPGKIEVPDFGGGPFESGPPVGLRVHPSGGGMTDGDEPVFWITLEATDEVGRVVDLSRFDIDANLSIVVTDPASELPASAEAVVLGRWDFTPVQTAAMVGNDPVPGIHIPIRWDNRRPAGEEVIVHARLRGEQEVLRCEGELPTVRDARLASQWLPRG